MLGKIFCHLFYIYMQFIPTSLQWCWALGGPPGMPVFRTSTVANYSKCVCCWFPSTFPLKCHSVDSFFFFPEQLGEFISHHNSPLPSWGIPWPQALGGAQSSIFSAPFWTVGLQLVDLGLSKDHHSLASSSSCWTLQHLDSCALAGSSASSTCLL